MKVISGKSISKSLSIVLRLKVSKQLLKLIHCRPTAETQTVAIAVVLAASLIQVLGFKNISRERYIQARQVHHLWRALAEGTYV